MYMERRVPTIMFRTRGLFRVYPHLVSALPRSPVANLTSHISRQAQKGPSIGAKSISPMRDAY